MTWTTIFDKQEGDTGLMVHAHDREGIIVSIYGIGRVTEYGLTYPEVKRLVEVLSDALEGVEE